MAFLPVAKKFAENLGNNASRHGHHLGDQIEGLPDTVTDTVQDTLEGAIGDVEKATGLNLPGNDHQTPAANDESWVRDNKSWVQKVTANSDIAHDAPLSR